MGLRHDAVPGVGEDTVTAPVTFRPGELVRLRGREWVVLPGSKGDILNLRPLGGSEQDATMVYVPLEPEPPAPASFDLPDPRMHGPQEAAVLLRDALRLKLRAGAGPFRSFGNLAVEPRTYQLVPLLMALKLDPVRLLIADDVGIGKTIEAGLIARELLDRGEIERLTVICPPHLCDQWQAELASKFHIEAEVVRPGTAARLERGLQPGESIFDAYPFTVVSLDYIKSERRRHDFLRACPEFVIVDEAHTCVQGNTLARHQRYDLLKDLAAAEPKRHLVLLTATPHSGDEAAFSNLLGLLDNKFQALADMPEGSRRQALRQELAAHFVQRRRADIAEWRDNTSFPVRESAEATYKLTGEWGAFFDDVLSYARTLVRRAEGKSVLQQRMSWWAALALLRCISSSPAAASIALRTRLQAVTDAPEEEQLAEIDELAGSRVMDSLDDDLLSQDETVPAGTTESPDDAEALRELIERAEKLRGPRNDPKLKLLLDRVSDLVADGYHPVIFCRYIATTHYVAEYLRQALPGDRYRVEAVTGELTSDQREERVNELGQLDEGLVPILVATDCLSEGINLQGVFNAVVHYDLSWNPTRHEQREGRVDRFGQSSPVVRTLMIYGQDNPVDGAVLKVILRKAERIRKELGVSVPVPVDNDKVLHAIMRTVLLRSDGRVRQTQLDFGDTERQVDIEWQKAKERMSRTVFAQRRLRPDEVLPEWRKSVEILGSEEDVERFVCMAAERLGAPLEKRGNWYRLPVLHLPKPLQEQLEAVGIRRAPRLAFRHPAPPGSEYVHRTHPLVTVLADFIAEAALENQEPRYGARCNAVFTRAVKQKTTVYLLRLRHQIAVEKRAAEGKFVLADTLLAEECLGVAVEGSSAPTIVSQYDALSLMSAEPARNMDGAQKEFFIRASIETVESLQPAFEKIAYKRAGELLEDHRRVREASDARGVRYSVSPALPVDVIGVYVLVPAAAL